MLRGDAEPVALVNLEGSHRKKFQAPMQVYTVGAPFERIAIDVLGPLPETEQGNRYIVIIMETFSKWLETRHA